MSTSPFSPEPAESPGTTPPYWPPPPGWAPAAAPSAPTWAEVSSTDQQGGALVGRWKKLSSIKQGVLIFAAAVVVVVFLGLALALAHRRGATSGPDYNAGWNCVVDLWNNGSDGSSLSQIESVCESTPSAYVGYSGNELPSGVVAAFDNGVKAAVRAEGGTP
jgi:hypothetical protein